MVIAHGGQMPEARIEPPQARHCRADGFGTVTMKEDPSE